MTDDISVMDGPQRNFASVPESIRQAALDAYGILDTFDEQDYDDITKLAAAICATPTALISFVDRDRQWFKSRFGFAGRQTTRAVSFCAHAIKNPDEVMVVEDATQDPRFAGNPLVLDPPHIRFYAGAPLVNAAGAALGTICVIAFQARCPEHTQIEALRILARQVMAQLELRRSYLALEVANGKLATQSLTDALTCIPNRRAFNARLAQEFARSDRDGNPLSLLMIDIDRFKSYNDAFGHQAGDEALYEVAQILQEHARPYDFVARYGGEEFAVILSNTRAEAALRVADRLREAVASAEVRRGEADMLLTVSIGMATPASGGIQNMLRAADAALYRAKAFGRNRVVAA